MWFMMMNQPGIIISVPLYRFKIFITNSTVSFFNMIHSVVYDSH